MRNTGRITSKSMRFLELRRTFLLGYRRDNVLIFIKKLLREQQSERDRLNGDLEAMEALVHELSAENEALHLRKQQLEEWYARHVEDSKRT